MAKKIDFHDEFTKSRENLDLARQILMEDWLSMSQTIKQTWFDNKKYLNDRDGQPTFLDYFLRTFSIVNTNSMSIKSLTLTAASSKTFIDRSTRLWNFVMGGFGTLTYGINTYGTKR